VRAFWVTVTVVVAAERIEHAVSMATEVVGDPNAWVRVVVEEVDGEERP